MSFVLIFPCIFCKVARGAVVEGAHLHLRRGEPTEAKRGQVRQLNGHCRVERSQAV